MLVLSRRQNDQIVFPSLGIRVHVVRLDGKSVRLGIEAPRDIPVLRHELAEQWTEWREYPAGQRPGKLGRALRNRLHAAALGLHLLHRQLERGQQGEMEPNILRVFRELESIEREVSRLKEDEASVDDTPPRRALLVEDNRNESELLAGYLRSFNFEVATADNGGDALEYLHYHAEKPNIVLLDMNMPDVDGPSTIDEIRRDPATADLKIFAVSGMSPEDCDVVVGPCGVDRWFCKPVRPDVLVDAINRVIDQMPA